jgi:uncharacterized protein (TIRG00374 family)
MKISRKRSPLLWFFIMLFAFVLLAWALSSAPLAEIVAVLEQLSLWQITTLLLLNTAIVLLLSLRWWLILRAQGHHLPFLSIARYRLAAFGVSYFTPGPHFGGEPLQILFLQRKQALPASAALASVTLDKVVELISNLAFLSISLAIVLNGNVFDLDILEEAQLISAFLLILPLVYLLSLLRGRGLASRLLNSIDKNWVKTVKNGEKQLIQLLGKNRKLLPQVILASLLLWMALLFEYWLALRFLGLNLNLLSLLAVVVAARLAMFAPTPGALGALEAAQVFAMQSLGFDPAIGLSLSFLIRARDLLFGGLGLWFGSEITRGD